MSLREAFATAHRSLAMLCWPYLRLELPCWGRLGRALAITGFPNDRFWQAAPTRTIRDKESGYRIELDLRKSTERGTYFLGRYVSLDILLCLRRILKPGDHFIDGGANIGLTTLLAVRLVGPAGRVMAFEPNPEVFKRLQLTIRSNNLNGNVVLYPLALGDADETLTLKVIDDSSETGTLAESLSDQMKQAVTGTTSVSVRRGDGVLIPELDDVRSLVLKLDVEGFELRALQGLSETVERFRPAILTEVHQPKMRAAGTDALSLFDWMSSRGYHAFALDLRRCGLGRRLRLCSMSTPANLPEQSDLLWLHRDSHALAEAAREQCGD